MKENKRFWNIQLFEGQYKDKVCVIFIGERGSGKSEKAKRRKTRSMVSAKTTRNRG